MAEHKITYRWTPRDAENATKPAPADPPADAAGKWKDYQARQLTPYGFVREDLPGCASIKAGAIVPIDLATSFRYPFEVMRFGHSPFPPKFPADIEWTETPAEARDCGTIGDLCKKLLELAKGDYGPKYGGIYDAFASDDDKTLTERRELARAIFDYWENTSCRYGVMTSGKADWSDVFSKPWALPTKADVAEDKGTVTFRITRIPAHRPRKAMNPVAPGVQVVKAPDPLISVLDLDILEIEACVGEITKVLKKSRALVDERMRLVAQLTGLEALVRMSADANVADNDAMPFKARLQPLPEQVRKFIMDTPESTFLGAMDSPVEALKRQLAPIDDFGEEVERLSATLLEKLIGEKLGKKSAAWAKAILEKELQDHPDVQLRLGRLGQLAVAALEAVADGKSGDSDAWADTLWKILEQAGDPSAAVTPGTIKDSSFLDMMISLLGKRANQGTALTIAGNVGGNLPGYPSITVAIAQTAAQWKLAKVVAMAQQGDLSGLEGLNTRLLLAFKRALGNDATLVDQFEQATRSAAQSASAAADAANKLATSTLYADLEAANLAKASANAKAAEANKLSEKIRTQIGANWQTAAGFKCFAASLQIAAFIININVLMKQKSDLNSSDKTKPLDRVVWMLNCAGAFPQLVLVQAAAVDAGLTALAAISAPAAQSVATKLGYNSVAGVSKWSGNVGFAAGKISAVLSVITGTVTCVNELYNNQWSFAKSDGYTLASGALGATSGVLTLLSSYVAAESSMTMATYLTASVTCPPLAAFAAITAALSIAVLLVEEEQKQQKQAFNKIVAADLESLRTNRYYTPVLRLNKDVAAVFTDLDAKLKDGYFTRPLNTPFTWEALRRAGFSRADVTSVVGSIPWGGTGGMPAASSP